MFYNFGLFCIEIYGSCFVIAYAPFILISNAQFLYHRIWSMWWFNNSRCKLPENSGLQYQAKYNSDKEAEDNKWWTEGWANGWVEKCEFEQIRQWSSFLYLWGQTSLRWYTSCSSGDLQQQSSIVCVKMSISHRHAYDVISVASFTLPVQDLFYTSSL